MEYMLDIQNKKFPVGFHVIRQLKEIFFALIVPLYCQPVGRHRRPLLGVSQFGVSDQPPLKKYLVKHPFAS